MSAIDIKAEITDIQRFCMHDGPGLRTVVFFKGCPLRCAWCHNPETNRAGRELTLDRGKCVGCGACVKACPNGAQLFGDERAVDRGRCDACGKCVGACPCAALEICGKTVSVGQIVEAVMRDAPFYGKEGGITVSGGEPTFQPKALTALMSSVKERGVNTALETCGAFDGLLAPRIAEVTDTVLFDIKDTDAERLREFTGGDLSNIIANLSVFDGAGVDIVLRCPIILEVNACESHAVALAALAHSLRRAKYVELLPYHPYGISKAENVGVKQREFRKPNDDEMLAFAKHLTSKGVLVKYKGSIL